MDWIGRYEVVGRIGSGGFATVYRVRDPALDSEVAAKVLADNWCHDPEIRDRFIREAQLLRRIDSDRVVTVHDIGELPTGQPYFVMALAERGTLESRLADTTSPSPADVMGIGQLLAECVASVHSHELIHRDIKPSNLLIAGSRTSTINPAAGGLLDASERLVLGDFGLAKDTALTSTGITIAAGTGGYAAPEQMTPGGAPDRRTDLYAATGVMYRVVSGTTPPPYSIASQAVPFDDAAWWMAGPLGHFFRRGMAFNQDDRHPSIEAWHADFSAALSAGSTMMAPPPAAGGLRVAPPSGYQQPAAGWPSPSSYPPAPGSGQAPAPSVPYHAAPSSPATPPPAMPAPSSVPPGPPVTPPPYRAPQAAPLAAGRQARGARPGPQSPVKRRRRWTPLVLVAVLVAVLGGGYYFYDQSQFTIDGDGKVEAGATARYAAPLDGAVSWEWTDWNGDVQHTGPGEEFEVKAQVPGELSFAVRALDGQGEELASAQRTITVVDSPDGPTIEGPDTITLGSTVEYRYTVPDWVVVERAEWFDPNTGTWTVGDTNNLSASRAGDYRIVLRVTLSDGRVIGATRTVELGG